MASVNKVILVGNLGADPETKYLPSGDAVTNIRIATTDRWKDKASGEMKEATEWHRIAFFGRLAEIAGEYLKKGSQVYVEGRIRTRKWQDKEGQDRYSTEIVADSMQMLGPLAVCPSCGKRKYQKQLSAAGFQLKGTGWYATDFKGGAKKSADKKPDAKTESKPDAKPESKPEAKPEKKSESKATA